MAKKTLEKITQAYDKYYLGAKIEEMIYKNRERIRDDKIVKPSSLVAEPEILVMPTQWTLKKI